MSDEQPIMLVDDAPNERPIAELYVVLSIDDEGREGICGSNNNQLGLFLPLVGSSETNLEYFRKEARFLAAHSKKRLKIVKFTARIELEEVSGEVDEWPEEIK